MEHYITQFIEDLQERHKPDAEPITPTFDQTDDSEDLFGEVEHYPSDVLAGAVIGAGSSFVTYKANRWLQGRRK